MIVLIFDKGEIDNILLADRSSQLSVLLSESLGPLVGPEEGNFEKGSFPTARKHHFGVIFGWSRVFIYFQTLSLNLSLHERTKICNVWSMDFCHTGNDAKSWRFKYRFCNVTVSFLCSTIAIF